MATGDRKAKIGIIGGSGLNKPELISNSRELFVDTPFGKPSDALISGVINDVDCVLLCRHGRQHTIFPSAVNYRANIWALREAGCTHIIATTACGSLKEEVEPGDLVFLDQFIDRTTKRASTFYDGESNSPAGVCHIPMHNPFCSHTAKILIECAQELSIKHHAKGTNITVEGPRFSTRAESHLFCSWGADIINMTTVPEVVLAKEAGIPYVAIALVTDYDCWKEDDTVTKDKVMATMTTNAATVTKLLLSAIPKIAAADFTDISKEYKNVSDSSVMLPH